MQEIRWGSRCAGERDLLCMCMYLECEDGGGVYDPDYGEGRGQACCNFIIVLHNFGANMRAAATHSIKLKANLLRMLLLRLGRAGLAWTRQRTRLSTCTLR